MNVLLTGAAGQLGRALRATVPADVRINAFTASELDITRRDAVDAAIDRVRPSVIINCAGYTRVDDAERQQALAFSVNTQGVAHLAQAAMAVNARLLHVSTDYVFDGTKSTPYLPGDAPAPRSVYGASKRAGEERALELTNGTALIVRTSWLYDAGGNNFVSTMLRLMRERTELRVVADQIGTPTWAATFANMIWSSASRSTLRGIYHWSDDGCTSWYDFAVAIQEDAVATGLLARTVPIHPISTQDYAAAAHRPRYSVLDKTKTVTDLGITPIHWRAALRRMLEMLRPR